MRSADRRFVAGAVAAAAVVVVLVVALAGGGGDGAAAAPAARATALVPADTLVYVHLSTDPDRVQTQRALALARRFPGFDRIRGDLIRQLTAPACGVRASDLKGDEAALALVDTGRGATAGSLVLLDTGASSSGGSATRRCGPLRVARIGRFLVIGQPAALRIARDLADGKGRALADAPRYRRALAGLPAGRVADAWVSRDGVRRLLQPQGGLLGAAGFLLDRDDLQGAALALTARERAADVTVRAELDRGRDSATFTPHLQDDAPDGVFAYLGVRGLSDQLTQVLAATGAGGGALAGLGPLLERARARLVEEVGTGLDRDLLALLRGEVGLTLTPGLPAPTLTIVAAAPDPAATARVLRRLERPLARLLTVPGTTSPAWSHRDGVASLRLAAGVELHYAVDHRRLIIATHRAGVARVRDGGPRLVDSAAWRDVVGQTPKSTTSLVFLDLSQLLRLAEQTGLNDSRAYQSVRDDLGKVRAIGARSSRSADETTAEISLSIP